MDSTQASDLQNQIQSSYFSVGADGWDSSDNSLIMEEYRRAYAISNAQEGCCNDVGRGNSVPVVRNDVMIQCGPNSGTVASMLSIMEYRRLGI